MALGLLREQARAGLPVSSAGHLLLGFLKYYGRVFDLEARARGPPRSAVLWRSASSGLGTWRGAACPPHHTAPRAYLTSC